MLVRQARTKKLSIPYDVVLGSENSKSLLSETCALGVPSLQKSLVSIHVRATRVAADTRISAQLSPETYLKEFRDEYYVLTQEVISTVGTAPFICAYKYGPSSLLSDPVLLSPSPETIKIASAPAHEKARKTGTKAHHGARKQCAETP